MFFEPSTRTRASFELAGRRLGAEVLNLDINTSAVQKGETIIDTVETLQAMFCNIFVIRHQENNIQQKLSKYFGDNIHLVNAGDGTHAHPSQALLDMLTIRQHKPNFSELKVALIGDISHSRVAQSDLTALRLLGVSDIRLIGPSHLLPKESIDGTKTFESLEEGIKGVDVVMCLRIQKERMQSDEIPNFDEYYKRYGLNE